jgi:galactokinase
LLHALGGARKGAHFVRAPGRVNLIGDHTDYNDGFVLPMAIDRDCLLAYRPRDDGRIISCSLDVDGTVDVDAKGSDDPGQVEPPWGRFVAGAVRALLERGAAVRGADVAVSSTVPVGSGLSSSSALAVALTLALAHGAEFLLTADDAARTALDAEVRATGVPGGLMDQLTSLQGKPGHALLIDCRNLEIEPIPIPDTLAVVVAHSGVPRTLAGSEYAERRAACEAAAKQLGIAALRDATLDQVRDDPRARHVVSENQRVLAFAAALRDGDIEALGPLLLASHASLRGDYEVSTPELNDLVDRLVDAGALGARLTGAGFGGCAVALVQRQNVEDVLAAVEPHGFVAHAVAGAGPIDKV